MARDILGARIREKTKADFHELAELRDTNMSQLAEKLIEKEVAKAKKSGELPKK